MPPPPPLRCRLQGCSTAHVLVPKLLWRYKVSQGIESHLTFVPHHYPVNVVPVLFCRRRHCVMVEVEIMFSIWQFGRRAFLSLTLPRLRCCRCWWSFLHRRAAHSRRSGRTDGENIFYLPSWRTTRLRTLSLERRVNDDCPFPLFSREAQTQTSATSIRSNKKRHDAKCIMC